MLEKDKKYNVVLFRLKHARFSSPTLKADLTPSTRRSYYRFTATVFLTVEMVWRRTEKQHMPFVFVFGFERRSIFRNK